MSADELYDADVLDMAGDVICRLRSVTWEEITEIQEQYPAGDGYFVHWEPIE